MKPVQFTVTFTGEVADHIKIDDLYLSLNLEDVRIGRAKKLEDLGTDDGSLFEYETVNVEELEPE